MTVLKLTQIGNSVGVILPKDLLSRLGLEVGDALHLSEAPGGYLISAYDAEFEQQMQVAERILRGNRDMLRQLAK